MVHAPEIIDHVDAPIDRGEVMRYLGYPAGIAPSAGLQRILDQWIREGERRAEPRAVFAVLPVIESSWRAIRLRADGGVAEFEGAIGEFLGPSRLVAAFVATAGPGIDRLSAKLVEARDELAAMTVNAVGAERAEAAETAVIDRLRGEFRWQGLAPTLPYSPGYCGMDLRQQKTLFQLLGRETVGVTLTRDCLMRPLKSVSGLIGLGPVAEIEIHTSPCDRCELYNCAMRR
jgi:hypothetical protein